MIKQHITHMTQHRETNLETLMKGHGATQTGFTLWDIKKEKW